MASNKTIGGAALAEAARKITMKIKSAVAFRVSSALLISPSSNAQRSQCSSLNS